MSKWFSVLAFVFSLFIPAIPVSAATTDVIMFNEIRLGGPEIELADEINVKEYITLYNGGTETVSLEGWVVEYAKNPDAGLSEQFCDASSWDGFSEITVTQTELSGDLPAGSVTDPIIMQLNDTGSGSLRLIHELSDTTVVQDLVGWGEEAPCFEAEATATPTSGDSLIRYVDCEEGLPIDTNDNKENFALEEITNPGMIGAVSPDSCETETDNKFCEVVTVTEVLPNPAGTDGNNEFIEIHNPTDLEVSLDGCGLFADGKEYLFGADAVLKPSEYKAFYDSTTGIGLINSRGTEVSVISADEEYVQTIYPADLKDDISWAYISGKWQQTDNPTPGTANKPMSPEPVGVLATSDGLKPCRSDQFRNPATNRCKLIATASSSLKPCASDQFRNPETNRCKKIASASSSLKPCNPGQERNPATNRCRKVGGSSSELKPCDEDEERNPETNRCRKKQATLASADIADKVADENRDMLNYGVLGLVGASVIGYGAYEYRNDFRNKFANLKSRFFPKVSD